MRNSSGNNVKFKISARREWYDFDDNNTLIVTEREREKIN
jgi:hypothetical protein